MVRTPGLTDRNRALCPAELRDVLSEWPLGRPTQEIWSGQEDSNLRSRASEARALAKLSYALMALRRGFDPLSLGRQPSRLARCVTELESAADLKFLHRLPQTRAGTSNRKAARRSWTCQCPFASEVRVRSAAISCELRKRGTGVPAAIRTPTECLLRAIPLPVGVQARTPPRTCTAISGLKRSALSH